jgi:16S rRNA (cytosine1402-N4)-methyltransferase
MTEMTKGPHISVMADEVVAFFDGMKLKVFVEGTLGAAGHAKRILEAHPEIQTYIGFDQDPEALSIAKKVLEPWKDKVHFIHDNFSRMDHYLKEMKIEKVDGFFLT